MRYFMASYVKDLSGNIQFGSLLFSREAGVPTQKEIIALVYSEHPSWRPREGAPDKTIIVLNVSELPEDLYASLTSKEG